MSSRGPVDVEHLIRQAVGLRRLAVRLVGESDADDVLQDAVAAGMRSAPADSSALRHWLARVVKNLAASRHRADARRAAREVRASRPESTHSTEALVERMEVQRVVAEEVLRLDEPYRTAVLAVYFEGTSADAYARELSVPSATVRSWLKRGLDALRARLDRRFGGDRAAWSAMLAPIAGAGVAVAPSVVLGGLVMKKLIAACALLVLAVAVAWRASSGEPAAGSGGPAPSSERAVASMSASPLEPDADVSAPAADVPTRSVPIEPTSAAVRVSAGSVTGRVTWDPDGRPAFDVGVRLTSQAYVSRDGPAPQVFTERDGRFRFDAVRPGAYRLSLDRSTVAAKITVASGQSVDVPLAVPPGVDVVGRVLDVEGVPVPGAEVHIRESNSPWTRRVAIADAEGRYGLANVDRWTNFFARSRGFAPSGQRQATDDTKGTIDLYLGGPSGRVVGLVLDPGGRPVAGALVGLLAVDHGGVDPAGQNVAAAPTPEIRTDAEGRFAFEDAQPGPYQAHAFAPGFPGVHATIDVRAGRSSEVRFQLPPSARVRGTVVDATGAPVQGATIRVASLDFDARESIGSGPEGKFDTGYAPAGRVRLSASHKIGTAATLDLDLAPGADFEWSPTIGPLLSIRGRLVDVAGEPLTGRTVKLAWKNMLATTDDDGRFVFERVGAQAHSLAYDDGSLSARSGAVLPGRDDVLLVAETADARIVGRLVDSQGRACPNVILSCEYDRAKTAEDGAFEFRRVRSGSRSILLIGSQIRLTLATIDVTVGGFHDTGPLVSPGTGSLAVRVRSADGVPIGWTTPWIRRVGDGDGFVSERGWDERGTWTVDDLPAGEYVLGSGGGGALLRPEPFSIRAGQRTEIEAELRFGTTVPIEVVAADGAPLYDVTVDAHSGDGTLAGSASGRYPTGATTGSLTLTLPPGTYELRVRGDDGRSGRSTTTVIAERSTPRARIELR